MEGTAPHRCAAFSTTSTPLTGKDGWSAPGPEERQQQEEEVEKEEEGFSPDFPFFPFLGDEHEGFTA